MNLLHKQVQQTVDQAILLPVSEERKGILSPLIEYIQMKRENNEIPMLNFICTHNSRRSQFAQIWAGVAGHFFQIPVRCFSAGIEVTAFNERAVASLKQCGFRISVVQPGSNPVYAVSYSANQNPCFAFSKRFDDGSIPEDSFAAVMVCDHADENCPYIPLAERRIPVRYEDPKAFDDSPLEEEMYTKRSLQIASEMLFVFSQVSKSPT